MYKEILHRNQTSVIASVSLELWVLDEQLFIVLLSSDGLLVLKHPELVVAHDALRLGRCQDSLAGESD